jgi:putative ATPase
MEPAKRKVGNGPNRQIAKSEFQPVPVHLRDTSYKGFERIGSGEGYKYAHDYEGHYVEQEYMPVESKEKRFYFPSDQGYECKIRELRKSRGKKDD